MKVLERIAKMKDEIKTQVYEKEFNKLTKIFSKVDENQQKLAEGLIKEASELKSDLYILNQIKNETGYIRVHPSNHSIQKKTEVGLMILKIQSSYANIIKVLNSILNKNAIETDDDFDEFMSNK